MCTATTFRCGDYYFGRTLDYTFSYGESVVITPRNFPLRFRCVEDIPHHLAMIGMAHMEENMPLYYEATNEAGLSIAGLNFPDYAKYYSVAEGFDNIAPFECIPWILGQCRTLAEVRSLLERMRLVDISYSDALPLTSLHWLIADSSGAITVESGREGLKVFENPVGVLTNSPPFDYHMANLANYMALTAESPENRLAPGIPLQVYSRGMGALGLPGDLSSGSRFVRCAFTKANSSADGTEMGNVTQFFHILETVSHSRGTVAVDEGGQQITIYTSCCNTDRGIYYYTTYENRQVTAISMHHVNLEGEEPVVYELVNEQQVHYQN